jgi:hypothetical protein
MVIIKTCTSFLLLHVEYSLFFNMVQMYSLTATFPINIFLYFTLWLEQLFSALLISWVSQSQELLFCYLDFTTHLKL